MTPIVTGAYSFGESTEERLRRQLRAAEEAIEQLKDFAKQAAARPVVHGMITAVEEGTDPEGNQALYAWVLGGGMHARLLVTDKTMKAGDYVGIMVGQGLIGKLKSIPPEAGPTVSYVSKQSDQQIVVEMGQQQRVVYCFEDFGFKTGDKVILDHEGNCAVGKLIPPKRLIAEGFSRVAWDAVGGHKDAKRLIEEAVIWPMKFGKLLTAYGQRPSKGILFWGPPGCGKTLLARATATLVADGGNPGFFSVKGPELMSPWVGETERMICELFANARRHKQETGVRALVFVDEADSVMGHRSAGRLHHDISVPTFLTEMDGLDDHDAPLVILATNKPESIDEAIKREGRIDSAIEIKRPEVADLLELFEIYFKSRPLGAELSELCKHSTMLLSQSACWEHRSGAMVATLVDKATARAMHRDIALAVGKPSGITADDCVAAIGEASERYK